MDVIEPKFVNLGYGKNYSEEGFWNKIVGVVKSAGLELIYKALQLYYATQSPNCPTGVKAAIYAALGYFILPIDFIPDVILVVSFRMTCWPSGPHCQWPMTTALFRWSQITGIVEV